MREPARKKSIAPDIARALEPIEQNPARRRRLTTDDARNGIEYEVRRRDEIRSNDRPGSYEAEQVGCQTRR